MLCWRSFNQIKLYGRNAFNHFKSLSSPAVLSICPRLSLSMSPWWMCVASWWPRWWSSWWSWWWPPWPCSWWWWHGIREQGRVSLLSPPAWSNDHYPDRNLSLVKNIQWSFSCGICNKLRPLKVSQVIYKMSWGVNYLVLHLTNKMSKPHLLCL